MTRSSLVGVGLYLPCNSRYIVPWPGLVRSRAREDLRGAILFFFLGVGLAMRAFEKSRDEERPEVVRHGSNAKIRRTATDRFRRRFFPFSFFFFPPLDLFRLNFKTGRTPPTLGRATWATGQPDDNTSTPRQSTLHASTPRHLDISTLRQMSKGLSDNPASDYPDYL